MQNGQLDIVLPRVLRIREASGVKHCDKHQAHRKELESSQGYIRL
jgi:hypothetical protein